jgi:hypothetical protein
MILDGINLFLVFKFQDYLSVSVWCGGVFPAAATEIQGTFCNCLCAFSVRSSRKL